MPTETYPQAIIRGAAALKRGEEANWTLARLTYEHTFANGRVSSQPDRVSMEEWCRDIREESGRRFSTSTGRRYRAVWENHGLDASPPADKQITFHDAYAEVEGTPNRERMMEYEGVRLLERGTKEQKVEQAAALLRDPDVREAAKDVSTPLGGTVFGVAAEAKTQRQHEGEALDRVREARTQNDPVLKGLDESKAQNDLIAACFDFAKAVAALLPRVGRLPSRDSDAFLTNHFLQIGAAKARGAVEQVDDLVRTGTVGGGVDEFLKSVLEGEKPGK